MIEKVMRAVKSNNKKRGRNITIGAIVGMLLSCSAVMGADVVGLEITKDTSGEIKFSKNGTEFTPENPNNPYPENTWDKESITYTNNSGISVNSDSGNAYSLKLNGDLSGVSFINNGSVSATGSSQGYGIYNKDGSIKTITNNGSIYSERYGIYNNSTNHGTTNIKKITNNGRVYSEYYGIYNNSTNQGTANIEMIINSGSIYGKSGNGIYNISNNSGTSNIEMITNSGSIYGIDCGIYNNGYNSGTSSIRSIVNSGNIYGKNGGGIYNASFNLGTASIGSIANSGVIYGRGNAIVNEEGTISSGYNYGLLISGGSKVIYGTVDFAENKYGLVFIVDKGKYTLDSTYSGKFGAISHDERVIIDYGKKGDEELDFANPKTKIYTIVNAKANEASDSVTGTENLVLKNGTLFHEDSDTSGIEDYSSDKNYILNGITDTLLVKGKNNKVNNSIINAYKTAVVMNGESSLTLENTVVNGGIDETSPAILVTENNNFLTIKGNSIVNGDIKATGDKNTLNLYGKQNMTRSSDSKSMNILHDIEGFGRIQIENNVTFFEDAKVTGVERLNINKGGTLSLRLKKDGAKATHALSAENTGLLITGKEEGGSETAGTLNFITNGMGTGTVIDMEGIELENVFLRANSILYDLEVVDTEDVGVAAVGDIKLDVGASLSEIYNERAITFDPYPKYKVIPNEVLYTSLNKIYQSSVKTSNNVNAITDMIASASDEEQWEKLLSFLGGIYTESPYSYSSELSRRSVGMFRDIVTENEFRPNLNNWLIMGGLTHADGGTKDTYYGKNYYKIDSGSSTTNADMKLTGAYMLAKYGYSENLSLGLTLGGNKSEAKLSMSKVKGNSGYLGAFAENYRGNLTLKAGAGVQYSEYDANRSTLGGHSYSDKYSDMTYDIYLNGRYSNPIGDNLFLESYATLSYTYVDQDGANEGSKALAIDTDSQSFEYTVGKVGVDLKKVIPHEKGKSTLSAGVSYTRIFDGADEEHITGRFKGGSDFDILVGHKNEHSVGVNAKYALELENGVIFDVKGSYSVERDSHNGSGKNKAKGEWIAGAGMGYKF